VQSWTTYSQSSRRGNEGRDIRLLRGSASIGPPLSESAPRRCGSSGRSRDKNSGAIPASPQTPIPSSSLSSNDDEGVPDQGDDSGNEDAHVYPPTLLDPDVPYTLASRKEALVELFTLHGLVHGEERRLSRTHDKIKMSRERTADKDIRLVNEGFMK